MMPPQHRDLNEALARAFYVQACLFLGIEPNARGSQARIARELGISAARMSQVLSGDFSVDTLCDYIVAWGRAGNPEMAFIATRDKRWVLPASALSILDHPEAPGALDELHRALGSASLATSRLRAMFDPTT